MMDYSSKCDDDLIPIFWRTGIDWWEGDQSFGVWKSRAATDAIIFLKLLSWDRQLIIVLSRDNKARFLVVPR